MMIFQLCWNSVVHLITNNWQNTQGHTHYVKWIPWIKVNLWRKSKYVFNILTFLAFLLCYIMFFFLEYSSNRKKQPSIIKFLFFNWITKLAWKFTVNAIGIHVLFLSGSSSIPFLWNWIPIELYYPLVPIHKVSLLSVGIV